MTDSEFCTAHQICSNHRCVHKPDATETHQLITGVIVSG